MPSVTAGWTMRGHSFRIKVQPFGTEAENLWNPLYQGSWVYSQRGDSMVREKLSIGQERVVEKRLIHNLVE